MALLDQLIAQNRQEAAAMRTVQARERVRASMVPLNPTRPAVQPSTVSMAPENDTDTIASPLEAASALFGGTGRPPSQGPPPDRAKVDSVFAQLQRFSESRAGAAADNDDDDSSTPDAWLDSDESESDSDELRVAHTPMPQVSERSMDEVLGGGPGGDGNGQKSLLARVLDPDGGKNRTGLEGLLANERPSDPRERLRQRRRALERQRSGMTEDDYIYDKRGRRVRGARKMTMDDVKMGLVPPSQKASVDRNMTKEQIRRNVAQMRADGVVPNVPTE